MGQNKTLKFNHIEAENIRDGVQRATLRINDEKNISVDDIVQLIDKVQEEDSSSWEVFGEATINEVKVQRAGDLQLNGADFEKFGSLQQLYSQMQVFYGAPFDANTHVKVVSFNFRPYKNSKKLEVPKEDSAVHEELKMYSDGGSRGNPGPSASGYVLMTMKDEIVETNGEYLNITTNNQAEYHSLKLGLERAHQLGAKKVHVYMDSMLVINQMKGIYQVKNKDLKLVFNNVKSLAESFEKITFTHVPRELNKLADAEVNRILDSISK